MILISSHAGLGFQIMQPTALLGIIFFASLSSVCMYIRVCMYVCMYVRILSQGQKHSTDRNRYVK